MAGLVPAIHGLLYSRKERGGTPFLRRQRKNVEARDKPGHDDLLEHLIHGLLAAAGAVA
jgi:hypothetical protein